MCFGMPVFADPSMLIDIVENIIILLAISTNATDDDVDAIWDNVK